MDPSTAITVPPLEAPAEVKIFRDEGLHMGISADQGPLGASLFKIQEIVKKLDVDGNRDMSVDEVKVLISTMTSIPVEVIPDDHEEVLG